MLPFWKYQGTGNDFVMIDNRQNIFDASNEEWIATLCDRRFGIGGDGLILIEQDKEEDFKMVYFNSDGKESTMCGNGGRCIVAFAKQLGIINESCRFTAVDGLHYATIDKEEIVSLQMVNVNEVEVKEKGVFLNTGSPHHVEIVRNLAYFDVYKKGKQIRTSESYAPKGTNVNFVEQEGPNHFRIRTFERGVEDETLSCGTGATAVALAMHALGKVDEQEIKIEVEGGELVVSFEYKDERYQNVFLKGPATFVFQGTIEI
ncbi:diaminopimelate epimerase [Myroides odoratus]|uniref:diaminopimelate epimerase n=1 Tax=Myroides odoratus TaxID=256 RepID=UPI0039B0B2C1